MRACINCGSQIDETPVADSTIYDRGVFKKLCQGCRVALVKSAQHGSASTGANFRDLLNHLGERLERGYRFKHSALSTELLWTQSLEPTGGKVKREAPLRRIQQRYIESGDYAQFLRDLDEAIKQYGDDLLW